MLIMAEKQGSGANAVPGIGRPDRVRRDLHDSSLPDQDTPNEHHDRDRPHLGHGHLFHVLACSSRRNVPGES